MACGCSSKTPEISSNGVVNCSNITKEDFEYYRAKYQCIIDNDYYDKVGYDYTFVQSRVDQLTNAINDKDHNPNSCLNESLYNIVIEEGQIITIQTGC